MNPKPIIELIVLILMAEFRWFINIFIQKRKKKARDKPITAPKVNDMPKLNE